MVKESTQKTTKDESQTSAKDFASMPHEKVQEIASKGGHASAEKAGHEGMSERGHKGGEARKEQLGPEGYAELGKKGGKASHKASFKNQDEDEDDVELEED